MLDSKYSQREAVPKSMSRNVNKKNNYINTKEAKGKSMILVLYGLQLVKRHIWGMKQYQTVKEVKKSCLILVHIDNFKFLQAYFWAKATNVLG